MGALTTKESGLTDKQELFCQHYVANKLNQSQAAIDAGYSLHNQGFENLEKPGIIARIRELLTPFLPSPELVLADIAQHAAGLPESCYKTDAQGLDYDWDEINRLGLKHLFKEINYARNGKRTYKLENRLHALELLSKYHGLLVNRTEVNLHGGNTVQIALVDDWRNKHVAVLDTIDAQYTSNNALAEPHSDGADPGIVNAPAVSSPTQLEAHLVIDPDPTLD